MEEKPPTERRGRSPRPAFSAPPQPSPEQNPPAPAPRRAAKAAPAVTFQPPSAENHPDERPASAETSSQKPPSRTQRRRAPESRRSRPEPEEGREIPAQPRPTPQNAPARTEPAEAAQAPAAEPAPKPAKRAPVKKATPAKKAAPPAQAAPAKAAPAKAAPAKAAPAKKAVLPAEAAATKAAPAKKAVRKAAPTKAAAVPLTEPQTAVTLVKEPAYREPWAKLIADPGHTPELLALAAVQTFGPRAKAWAAETRDSYPAASDRALARLAARQFTRFGGLGSVFGALAGSYASVALLGAAAITHAELILHVAAAYGLDPTDAERAADLLVITRVHATRAEAEEALTAAERPAYEEGGLSDSVWRVGRKLAAYTGGWAAFRLVNRYFPGTSLLAAVLTGTTAAEAVAVRAEAYYKSARLTPR